LGWADHNEVLRTSDADRDLYSKEFNAGEVAIGGNLAGGAVGVDSNYSVFIVGVEGPSDGQENELPVASFNATPNSGEAPLTVNFDASESTDPDGSIASYDWAFGDGKSGTGKTINHEFDEPGTYDVMLTVTDDVGGSDTAQDTIEVEEPQEKGLTADPPGFCRGLPATLSGTQGDDIIEGTPSRDVIIGMAGNDTIRGHQGNDIICGGDGDDEIFGNGDNDILEGGGGNDRISGGYGRDIVHGGDGDDWVAGGWGVEDGPDIVSGGRGHDFVFGGEGDDVLWGGAGRDHLYGGPGNDTLHGNGSWDRLRGGSGNDSLYGNGARDFLFGEEGDDDLYGGEGTDACHGGSGINSFVNCE
jgi:Ca2+-binding RTX toxin-like protein